jgi:mono/diheme cytochrome c family protein
MKLLATIGFLAIVAVLAAAGYFLGGYYSVAGIEPDNSAVTWAMTRVRTASIEQHAPTSPAVNVDDAATIQNGARAFAARGCAICHGAPGVDWAKFAEGLRPDAADLAEVSKARSAGQIFWVVKNGINMTGMPSFARASVADDEIWRIAAFVKKLGSVTPEDYKKWTSATP